MPYVLFSTGTINESSAAIGIAIISLLGTAFAILKDSFLKWNERKMIEDKLRFDTETAVKAATLEAIVKSQGEMIATSQAQMNSMSIALQECKEDHHKSEVDRDKLRTELETLRGYMEKSPHIDTNTKG